MKNIGSYPSIRLRRNRKKDWTRRLLEESNLSSGDLIWPIFICDGKNKTESIKTMPNVYRYSIDSLDRIVEKALKNNLKKRKIFLKQNQKKK